MLGTMPRTLVLLPVLASAALFGCRTLPTEIPSDLSPQELFQLAQEEADRNNYAAAEVYYQTVLERFPNDPEQIASARYNVGLMQYRDGRPEEAAASLEGLLELYESDEIPGLPAWPEALARIILEEIRTGE